MMNNQPEPENIGDGIDQIFAKIFHQSDNTQKTEEIKRATLVANIALQIYAPMVCTMQRPVSSAVRLAFEAAEEFEAEAKRRYDAILKRHSDEKEQ